MSYLKANDNIEIQRRKKYIALLIFSIKQQKVHKNGSSSKEERDKNKIAKREKGKGRKKREKGTEGKQKGKIPKIDTL